MRYAIKVARGWRPLFSLFGFSPARSYVELDQDALHLHYGTAHERVPLAEITTVARRHWPFYFGLGAKYGPRGGVAYVGSTEGVVQIDFAQPRPMNVWGPFRASRARCVAVSLEQPDQFINDLKAALNKLGAAPAA